MKENSDFNTEAPNYYQQTKNGSYSCKYNNCQYSCSWFTCVKRHWQSIDHLQLWNSFNRESIPRSMNEKVDFEVNIVNNEFEINCTHCNKFTEKRNSVFNDKNQTEMKNHWLEQKHKCNSANIAEYFLYVIRNELRYYCIQCGIHFTNITIAPHFSTIHKTKIVKLKVCI